jgi:hypothetical protein
MKLDDTTYYATLYFYFSSDRQVDTTPHCAVTLRTSHKKKQHIAAAYVAVSNPLKPKLV